MSTCEHEAARAEAAAASGCHGKASAAQDDCCDVPQRRDYLFWVSLVVVVAAYPIGATMHHEQDSVIGVFTADHHTANNTDRGGAESVPVGIAWTLRWALG
jgi:hypothetical protein